MITPIIYDKKCTYQPLAEPPEGTAVPYQAMDTALKRIICVKQVAIPGEDRRTRDANLAKAMKEVRLMVKAGEENLPVPAIYDAYYDPKKSLLYIFMEWIKGKTLREYMSQPSQVLGYMRDLSGILDLMHRRDGLQIDHKDIKPENIMITGLGQLRLIDFNISGSLPNLVEGTYFYKAPEMTYERLSADRSRSDMFSIGVILYEAFTGKLPKPGIHYSPDDRMNWKRFKEPIALSPDMPQAVNRIIVRCMKCQPRDRYRSYGELNREIKNALRQMRSPGKQHYGKTASSDNKI